MGCFCYKTAIKRTVSTDFSMILAPKLERFVSKNAAGVRNACSTRRSAETASCWRNSLNWREAGQSCGEIALLGKKRSCSQTWLRLKQTGQRGSGRDCSARYEGVLLPNMTATSTDGTTGLGARLCCLVQSGVLGALEVHLPYFCDFHG